MDHRTYFDYICVGIFLALGMAAGMMMLERPFNILTLGYIAMHLWMNWAMYRDKEEAWM